MIEHAMDEQERDIVTAAAWRYWRSTSDARLVGPAKKKANVLKVRLNRRKAKLRIKLLTVFKVRTPW
jgi:hypothetical protein